MFEHLYKMVVTALSTISTMSTHPHPLVDTSLSHARMISSSFASSSTSSVNTGSTRSIVTIRFTRSDRSDAPRSDAPRSDAPRSDRRIRIVDSSVSAGSSQGTGTMYRLPKSMPHLLPHQLDAVRRMIEDRPRGMMLYHCMGSGKTISALAIAAALRSQREINDVVVLCPVNVKSAWEREAIRCGMLVEVMTHSSFQRYNYEKYKTLLIVDEAHNFRTLIKNKKKEKQKTFQLLNAASSSKRVILLTGTPIVNNPLDLRNLVMAMKGERYIDASSYNDPSMRNDSLMKSAAFLTHSYINYNHESLPAIKYETHDFYMDEVYQKWYEAVEQNVMEQLMIPSYTKFAFFSDRTRAFWNGVRRVTNGRVGSDGVVESPKLEWLCKSILQWKRDGEKAIVYSAWKTYGMSLMEDYVRLNGGEAARVRIGVIDGSVSNDMRASLVRDFNTGHLDVMLFTAAASEGMNLLATRHVVILEPHWNTARIDQAMSRARRMNSHASLPPEKRNVTVHHMLLHKTAASELDSIDDVMTMLSRRKMRFARSFDRMVGVSTSTSGSSDDYDDDEEEEEEDEDEDMCDDDDD